MHSDAADAPPVFELAVCNTDAVGVVGLDGFFFPSDSTLRTISGSGVDLGGLPLFRGEGIDVGVDFALEDEEVGVAVPFGGRPRFLPEEGARSAGSGSVFVVDFDGLPRFRC